MKSCLALLIFFCNAINFALSVLPDPYRKIDYMVDYYGYPFEKHVVETEDGYSIEIHRIPGGKGEKVNQTFIDKPPVYLLHALTQSSADWISVGPQLSLAFLLADEGFDVWLGNCRGNLFGRNHKIYLETSYGFWNFSWHEIGMYDMPTTIDMILHKTGKSQLYFGCFSQGCTASLVMGALKPDYNEKIRLAAEMGPVAFLGNMQGGGKILLPKITKLLVPVLEKFGHFDVTTIALLTILFTKLLKMQKIMSVIFSTIYAFVGPGRSNDNEQAIKMGAPFLLGGISSKQALHYGLGVLYPNTFRQYDYGSEQNMIVYNSSDPPDYPLEEVTMPMVIFQGTNDFCADPLDVELLVKRLPNVIDRFMRPVNHLDFGYNRNIRSLVYYKIVELFKKYENKTS